jgi:hypothetical protein
MAKIDRLLELLKANPADLNLKTDLAWEYYRKAKNQFATSDFLNAVDSLYELQGLGIGMNLFLNKGVIWLVIRILFKLGKEQGQSVNDILLIVRSFEFERPSEEYSILLKAALKHKAYCDFLGFAKWWRLKHLREADFLPETMELKTADAKKVPLLSLAERAYMAIASGLLELKTVDKELVKQFIKQLHSVSVANPKFVWLPYFEARLVLISGESRKEILERILPFMRSKRNEFWAWDLMARLYVNEKTVQLACYSAALLCRAKEDMLVKVNENFALLLIELNFLSEAKCLILNYLQLKERNGHKPLPVLLRCKQAVWWDSTQERREMKKFYQLHSPKAYELLYPAEDFKTAVIQRINETKKIVHFIVRKNLAGYFFYGKFAELSVGECVELQIKVVETKAGEEKKGNFYKLIKLQTTTKMAHNEVYKELKGVLQINKKTGHGSVEGVFVPKYFIEKNGFRHGEMVNLRAFLFFHVESGQWRWSVIK